MTDSIDPGIALALWLAAILAVLTVGAVVADWWERTTQRAEDEYLTKRWRERG